MAFDSSKLHAFDAITNSVKEGRQRAMVGQYAEAQGHILKAIELLKELQSHASNKDKYSKAIHELWD